MENTIALYLCMPNAAFVLTVIVIGFVTMERPKRKTFWFDF
jgi:hypothetical protein